MKKLIFVLFCCLIGMGAVMANEPDYVISDGNVYFVESLRVSPWNGFSGKSEGERLRFKSSEVEGYSKDGVVYRRLPVIVDNKVTDRTALMQALAFRGGYIIYRYTSPSGLYNKEVQYFVFKDKDYVLTVDYSLSKQMAMYFSYGK